MLQISNSSREMETRDHSKKRASLKSLISSSKVLIVAMLFLPVTLAAQITFAEKPQEKGPGWEYMRDIIMMPYDSTHLLIETYPILEAYRKYIGQQIFFMEGSDSDENVIHKYYEIIDVISYKNFLETELQKEETKQREKEKELRERQKAIDERTPKLRERENELNKTKIELEQDYKKKGSIENDLRNIEWQFQEIEKRKQIRNLSLGGQKDLRDKEKELRKREKVLLKNYDREKVLKELSEIENKLSEIEKELSETEEELTKIENESTLINDDLDGIQNYFDANVSNQRKERVTYMIKQKNYFFPCEDNPDSQCRYEIKDEDIPYFVLKNTQTKDTIYRTITTINYANRDKNNSDTYRAKDYDHGVILVGGFIKVKKDAVGKNFIFWRHSGWLDPEIGSIWECIDVSITKEISYLNFYDDKHSYSRDEKKHEIVSLTLRNNKKPDLIDHVRYSHITQRVGNHIIGSTSSTITSEKTFKEHELAFNRRKQDYNNLVAQEKAKLKQQLTAKYGAANADKIIAGKFEIGMSKAVCKEIAGYATVVDKTTTAETWKVSNFWTGSVTYLYFSGDKLARIVNR